MPKEKPCRDLGYCPYGELTDYFNRKADDQEKKCNFYDCMCPAFKVAEPAVDKTY